MCICGVSVCVYVVCVYVVGVGDVSVCVWCVCVVDRRELDWAYESTNLVLGRDPDPGSLAVTLTQMCWVQQQYLWH
jgi:hypothetical protein